MYKVQNPEQLSSYSKFTKYKWNKKSGLEFLFISNWFIPRQVIELCFGALFGTSNPSVKNI